MRPYIERINHSSFVPENIASCNQKLIGGEVSWSEAKTFVEDHSDSWDGVEGQFRRSSVSTSSLFVVDAETHIQERNKSSEAKLIVGRLGALQVVWLDLVIPEVDVYSVFAFQLPKLVPGSHRNRYKGFMIAAELHPVPSKNKRSGLIKKDHFVALSLPNTKLDLRARFYRDRPIPIPK